MGRMERIGHGPKGRGEGCELLSWASFASRPPAHSPPHAPSENGVAKHPSLLPILALPVCVWADHRQHLLDISFPSSPTLGGR